MLSRLKGILAAHGSVPAACTCTAITLPSTAWPGSPSFKCKLKIPSLQLRVPRQGRAPRSPSTEPSALQLHGALQTQQGQQHPQALHRSGWRSGQKPETAGVPARKGLRPLCPCPSPASAGYHAPAEPLARHSRARPQQGLGQRCSRKHYQEL